MESKGDMPSPGGIAGKILAECGIILRPLNATGSPFHSIECDQTDFVKKLRGKLKAAINYPDNVDHFLSNFVAYLESDGDEDYNILIKALQPTRTSPKAPDNARGAVQESTIRLLLQIDDLQTKLIGWLLEKLALISLDDNESKQNCARRAIGGSENMLVNKTQLILSQLRWLDQIVDGDALTDKFLEILNATSNQVTQEVIACLPEVIAEVSNHEKVAVALRNKLNEIGLFGGGGSMTNVIIDCLTNLTLSSDIAVELQTSILKSMDSFALEDRHVLVNFILQSTVTNMEANVVSQLRECLHLEQSKLFSQISATQRGKFSKRTALNSKRSTENDVALIMKYYTNINDEG